MLSVPAAIALALLAVASPVWGHGRLMDPPARNSMWRLGFPNPVNYNDNELYCGGRVTQWARNNGKCGVCGDPHHHTSREHEVGGKYANGIISRQYTQADVIGVTVHITANHKGYFEFRICPVSDPKLEVTQECLDQHLLEMANGEGTRYTLPEGKSNQFFNISLRLPADVTCKQCVIQWKYRTGNTWDKDETGRFCVGCGPQEEFYNCADVSIQAKDGLEADKPKDPVIKDMGVEKSSSTEGQVKRQQQSPIMFTDDSYQEKITDYGKQKVQFVQKLQTDAHPTWGQLVNSLPGEDEEVMQAHLAETGTRNQVESSTALGYLGDDYRPFRWGITATLPSSVTNIRQSDSVTYPERSRFGFVSSTKKMDDEKLWHYGDSEKRLGHPAQDVSAMDEADNAASRVDHSQTRPKPRTHTGFTASATPRPQGKTGQVQHKVMDQAVIAWHAKLRSLLESTNVTPQLLDSFLRRWKLQRLRQIAAAKAFNVSRSSSSDSSRDQILAQHQPSKTPSNQILAQHQPSKTPSNQILAQPQPSKTPSNHALAQNQPSKTPSNHARVQNQPSTTSNQILAQPRPPKTSSNDRVSNSHVTRPAPLVTSVSREQSQQHDVSAASPRQSLLPERSPVGSSHKKVKQSSSRQVYLKNKLPSWLVTTLKLKHRDTEDSVEEENKSPRPDNGVSQANKSPRPDNGVSQANKSPRPDNGVSQANKSPRSDNGVSQANKNPQEENNARKWYSNKQRFDKQGSLSSEINVKHVAASADRALGHKGTTARHIPEKSRGFENQQPLGRDMRLGGVEENMNSPSNVADKVRESKIKADAESLVRYIVKLLLSSKRGHEPGTPADKPVTLLTSEATNMSERLVSGSDVKATGAESSPRSIGVINQVDDLVRNRLGNDEGKPEGKYPNRQEISGMFDDRSQSSSYASPSVRAEAQPFHGLILGSDFDYNQGHVKGAMQRSGTWDKGYQSVSNIHKDYLGRTGNAGNNLINADNFLYQQKSADTSNSKPSTEIRAQQLLPQNPWFGSEVRSVPDNTVDYHHTWSSRALNRHGYYTNKQETTQTHLQCRSLVTLGGGMDKWCTDNCRANFCPPTMCACKSSLPTSSVYASLEDPLQPRSFITNKREKLIGEAMTNHRPSQRINQREQLIGAAMTNHESSQGVNQRRQLSGAVMTNHGINDGTYDSLGYAPENHGYIRADVRSHGQVPLLPPQQENIDVSYSRLHNVLPPTSMVSGNMRNIFDESKDNTNIISIGHEVSHNPDTMRLHRLDNTLSPAGYTKSLYSQYLGDLSHNRHTSITAGLTELDYDRQQDSRRDGNGKNQHIRSLPYIAKVMETSDFQETNPDSSLSLTWLPDVRKEERLSEHDAQPNILDRNVIRPFTTYKIQGHDRRTLVSHSLPRNKSYSVPKVLGQSFVGQNQFYPQLTSRNHPNRQQLVPKLKCQAMGAYAGLKHFDEWCESTCQSAMCPLLICSCDN